MRLAGQFARFVGSGGFNTALTYGAYLLLLQVLPYGVAYTVSYASGIALAFVLNRFWVFRAPQRRHGMVWHTALYLAQYLAGLGIVLLWVDVLGGPALLAPAVSIVLLLPLTFWLSRKVFVAA